MFKFPSCLNNVLYRCFYSEFENNKFGRAFRNKTKNMRFLVYLGKHVLGGGCLCGLLKRVIVFIFPLKGKHSYQSRIYQKVQVCSNGLYLLYWGEFSPSVKSGSLLTRC